MCLLKLYLKCVCVETKTLCKTDDSKPHYFKKKNSPKPRYIPADKVIMKEDVCSRSEDKFLKMEVGFLVTLAGLMAFIGWFLFVVFGGIGLAAVPMDFYFHYANRPTAVTRENHELSARVHA